MYITSAIANALQVSLNKKPLAIESSKTSGIIEGHAYIQVITKKNYIKLWYMTTLKNSLSKSWYSTINKLIHDNVMKVCLKTSHQR